jgi:hypothetical protein
LWRGKEIGDWRDEKETEERHERGRKNEERKIEKIIFYFLY